MNVNAVVNTPIDVNRTVYKLKSILVARGAVCDSHEQISHWVYTDRDGGSVHVSFYDHGWMSHHLVTSRTPAAQDEVDLVDLYRVDLVDLVERWWADW
jgi:hypothetical protein